MGRFSNVDPNFQQEQNRFLMLQALRSAKNAGPVSPKKALALIIPVFLAAAALLLLFSGAFGEKTYVRYQEHLYQLTGELVNELPEGYTRVGPLILTEDPKTSATELASNYSLNAEFYASSEHPKTAFISENGDFFRELKRR